MGATHSQKFDKQTNRLADIFKALAHPARIAILQKLRKDMSCACGSIVEEIPLSQPTISQHLKELKNAGLITGTIEGKKVCYCIDKAGWNEAMATISIILKPVQSDLDDCSC